jgi:hypothetical protein
MVEAGKAILKFYKRAKGNSEAVRGFKRGKSMSAKRSEQIMSANKKQS